MAKDKLNLTTTGSTDDADPLAELLGGEDKEELMAIRRGKTIAVLNWIRNRTDSKAPTPAEPILSPGERAIMDVLPARGEPRMTTRRVLDALERKHGPVSDGGTKQLLATLRRRKLIDNRQDTDPKGYARL